MSFQAWHTPSRGETCERAALPPIADACRWSLLLLSPLPSVGVAAPGPAQTLPRTRPLPNPGTDGFCQGRLRVYINQAPLRGAVALRSQTGLTGSGSHRSSYGGFGGGHPPFHPHTACRQPNPYTGRVSAVLPSARPWSSGNGVWGVPRRFAKGGALCACGVIRQGAQLPGTGVRGGVGWVRGGSPGKRP